MGTTRKAINNVYRCCFECDSYIFSRDHNQRTCKQGYDPTYHRVSKRNGCPKCTAWIEQVVTDRDHKRYESRDWEKIGKRPSR